MNHRDRGTAVVPLRIAVTCALVVAPLTLGLTACGDSSGASSTMPYDAADQVGFSGEAGGPVDPRRPLEVTSKTADGRIVDVSATDHMGRHLSGELNEDGTRWRSTAPMAAGARYTVRVSTENGRGTPGRRTLTFDTRPAEGRRLSVKFGPEKGTYGVGQPITARLSQEVRGARERAMVESALQVQSSPGVAGAWHWVNGKTLHYRPPSYWPVHATINVTSSLEGLRIREGLYGGDAEPLRIRTGDKVEAITDMARHTMVFKRNDKVVRTFPITTGKAGFRTRNGIKVILEKQASVRMTSGSIGIAAGSAESYDLPVYWASRLTWSGEYVHGAPWSVSSQGSANVSHGCTGMSSENARWFFEHVRPGDVAAYINGEGEDMAPFGNGFGDWNLSWSEWRQGSALYGGSPEDSGSPADAARLRPQV